MASPGNRHCANCIGTRSFPLRHQATWAWLVYRVYATQQLLVSCCHKEEVAAGHKFTTQSHYNARLAASRHENSKLKPPARY